MIGDEYSKIEVTEHRNGLGAIERYSYEWKGKSPKVAVSRWLEEEADPLLFKWIDQETIQIGPYKLKCVKTDYWLGDYKVYVRIDYPFWWLIIFWYRFTPLLDLIYRRLIITLAVWNLASYDRRTVPSHHNIYLINWIKKVMTPPVEPEEDLHDG